MEYLLVDAYNVINAWNNVFKVDTEPLENSRDKLLNILSNYQGYKKINIIVVFDAHMVEKGRKKKEKFDNLQIIYTKENQTADNYIERFVYTNAKQNIVRVVTSDYLEQTIVLSNGGIRMSTREFWEDIEYTVKNARQKILQKEKINKSNTIMSNIDDELLQKLEKIRRGH